MTQLDPIFNLPETFKEDAKRFEKESARFRCGEVSAAEFRSFRVPMGVYEQRENDTFMLRVRCPAGGVWPQQMKTLAKVAREVGNGVLHVTTRQDIQIHRVLLKDIPQAFARLYASGLSTRGGGGNTVRNITACEDAGVCSREVFDPSAHAVALTEFMLPDPLSYQLPRKYKIAFSGCPEDCAGATVHDVGFIARSRDGVRGFAVYVGGGLGGGSRVAQLMEEFVPEIYVHRVAEAIKRVFDKNGNRKNRHKARLRFLIEKIGLDEFRKLYQSEMAGLLKAGTPDLALRQGSVPQRPVRKEGIKPTQGFGEWRAKNVFSQKQEGYYLVRISLPLGDVSADVFERFADVVENYGEGTVRATQSQNLVLRWVSEDELRGLYGRLKDLGLAVCDPPVLRNLVACAGASTCRLGICLSRGLVKAIRTTLEKDGRDLQGLGDLRIHVSGCPNACGRHLIADIGFHGAARRVKDRLVPHYVLQWGGRLAEGKTRLASGKQAVPARNVPALVVDFLEAFRRSSRCPDFEGFLGAEGGQVAETLASRYAFVPDFEVDKNFYFDWDSEEIFSMAGRGPGECGAGVFDMIEVDLASARDAVAQNRLFDAIMFASRALLVTRGQQAGGASEALNLFTQYFIDEGLVDEVLTRALVKKAVWAASHTHPASAFDAKTSDVAAFVETVQKLYESMDASLRFKPVKEPPAPAAIQEAVLSPKIAREADFRGVVCPLNFVKTKMTLDRLQSGDVLSVLLDEQGAKNVPESVRGEGHEVLSVGREGESYRVLIRKV